MTASDFVFDIVLKGTLVFAGGWVVTMAMYRASAASRHAVWAAVCVAALALPILSGVLPSVPAKWWPQLSSNGTAPGAAGPVTTLTSSEIQTGATMAGIEEAGSPSPVVSPGARMLIAIGMLWCVGFAVALGRMAIGGRAARRLTSAADPEHDVRILDRAELIGGWLGAPAFVVRRGGPDWMPATWGVRPPVVVLPATAGAWPDARLDPVLVHELAHVARRDAVWQQVARVMVAVWWLHPLAWLAARRLRDERERACDDCVLDFGARASDYANELVSLVGECSRTELTLAMARRSQLEGRVMAILNPRINRNGRTGIATLVAVGLVLAIAPLASLTSRTSTPLTVDVTAAETAPAPQQQTPVRVGSGVTPPKRIHWVAPIYPPIALSARVQGVVIIEAVIDATGAVTDAKVIRPVALLDDAALDAVRQWRFTPTELNGVPVPVITTLTVNFTLGPDGTSMAPPPPPPPPPADTDELALLRTQVRALQARLKLLEAQRAAQVGQVAPTWNPGDPPLRAGGRVTDPKRIKYVAPVYPEIALSAGVQGVVILELTINERGRVTDAKVVRPVALLDQAAMDAVMQWEFEPVLLNGQPVPVIATVTVNFTVRDVS
jgi:TonB family protein